MGSYEGNEPCGKGVGLFFLFFFLFLPAVVVYTHSMFEAIKTVMGFIHCWLFFHALTKSRLKRQAI